MNILPKKRWHVRNRENIARVRKDEAKAKQEELEKEQRRMVAQREARTNFLRQKAKGNVLTEDFITLSPHENKSESEHINFFSELEEGHEESNKPNKNHEIEEKNEREKYEKQIGYLTYLGQDTNEILGKKNWYDKVPEREYFKGDEAREEMNLKNKLKEDPVEILRKYGITKQKKKSTEKPNKFEYQKSMLHSKKNETQIYSNSSLISKKKKHKNKRSKRDTFSDDSQALEKKRKLDLLRQERLQREAIEKERSNKLLAVMNNKGKSSNTEKRKYNSQFNPEIAKQNFNVK